MKKRYNNRFKFITFFIAIIFIALACEKEAFEEYSSVPADPAPALTINVDAQPFDLTVNYSFASEGRLTVMIMPGDIDTVPALEAMMARVFDDALDFEFIKTDGTNGSVVMDGLYADNDYKVFALASNADGSFSEIIASSVIRTPEPPLSLIFEEFLGDYQCVDLLNADSASVDWGPYGVVITENTATTEPYDIIVNNFWAWGGTSTAVYTLEENGTVTCDFQIVGGIDMGDVYDASLAGNPIEIEQIATGKWDYHDFDYTFHIPIQFTNTTYGSIYDDIFQVYFLGSKSKSTSNKK